MLISDAISRSKQQKHPRLSPGMLRWSANELPLGLDGLGDGGSAGGGLAFGLADIDAAFEECAVFNADAGGGDVAGERAFAADVDAVGGEDVAANLAEDDDFAGGDVGGYLAVASDGDAVAGEVDGALDFAIDEEGLGAADLSLDDEALADGGLIAGGGGGAHGRLVGGGGRRGPNGLRYGSHG